MAALHKYVEKDEKEALAACLEAALADTQRDAAASGQARAPRGRALLPFPRPPCPALPRSLLHCTLMPPTPHSESCLTAALMLPSPQT